MKFDLFCSLCQGSLTQDLPKEKKILENFLSQAKLADHLGIETLWLAESHLSSETQKKNKKPVIPHFKGEVSLNTDSFQLAHLVYSSTKKIGLGTAIRNIVCNGGPLAHAEAVRYFLFLQELSKFKDRSLRLGFASGRFEYSNSPYSIRPRDAFEENFWPEVKGKVLKEACQIFLKGILGHEFSSAEIENSFIRKEDVKSEKIWEEMLKTLSRRSDYEISENTIRLKKWWLFEEVKVIPNDVSLKKVEFYIGSHSPEIQNLANDITPCKVFNLSITSEEVIEETHKRMEEVYRQKNLSWKREFMPRTVLVFLNGDKSLSSKEQSNRAKEHAKKALTTYWQALEGTIDPVKIEKATDNALCGNPQEVCEQIESRFHREDRLMLWFDLNCHENLVIKNSMKCFFEDVASYFN